MNRLFVLHILSASFSLSFKLEKKKNVTSNTNTYIDT